MINWKKPDKKPSTSEFVLVAVNYGSSIDTHIARWVGNFTEEDYTGEMSESDLVYREFDGNYYLPCGWYQQAHESAENCGYFIDSEVLAWAKLPKFEGLK
jgi:hypothetical protein